VPPDECSILCGDPGRLKQVLTNLLGNAVKFTERGGVSLIVSVAEESPEEVLLGFAIRDTGIGIDAAAQQEIFEPFHQADGSNSRKYGGTGLGLTISRQIIEALGGRLEVDSEPGLGSEFRFTLRFEKSKTFSEATESFPEALENLRVLVVDDNATTRDILQRQLANLRTRPVAVAGGREALEFLRAAAADGAPVSIAILDMQMPDMDGIALVKLIKAEPPIASTRLILLSSLGDDLTDDELREAGVEQSIVKPVKQSRLGDSLVTMLTGRTESSLKQGAVAEDAPRQSIRILLAEDNRVNQQVALLQLKRLGYSADLAANGSEALAALERVPYDVVLMDCQMPGMDGYEATRRIRELYQRPIHIIAMTANAMDGDREKCLEAGMDEHLGKPVHIDDLKRLLGEWMPPAAAADPPPVDLARLTEVTGTDSGMFRRITNDYLEQAEEILALLNNAIEKRHGGETRQLAHKLGGSSASCGIIAMEEPLSRLEHMGESFQPQAARALYQQSIDALLRVRQFLSARPQSSDPDH
jgi:CheY-like chemotaxis protein